MSANIACTDRKAHQPHWYVIQRYCNYSAFNGYHRTPSDYSAIRCPTCRGVWRTKAAYVATLPDAPAGWENGP